MWVMGLGRGRLACWISWLVTCISCLAIALEDQSLPPSEPAKASLTASLAEAGRGERVKRSKGLNRSNADR